MPDRFKWPAGGEGEGKPPDIGGIPLQPFREPQELVIGGWKLPRKRRGKVDDARRQDFLVNLRKVENHVKFHGLRLKDADFKGLAKAAVGWSESPPMAEELYRPLSECLQKEPRYFVLLVGMVEHEKDVVGLKGLADVAFQFVGGSAGDESEGRKIALFRGLGRRLTGEMPHLTKVRLAMDLVDVMPQELRTVHDARLSYELRESITSSGRSLGLTRQKRGSQLQKDLTDACWKLEKSYEDYLKNMEYRIAGEKLERFSNLDAEQMARLDSAWKLVNKRLGEVDFSEFPQDVQRRVKVVPLFLSHLIASHMKVGEVEDGETAGVLSLKTGELPVGDDLFWRNENAIASYLFRQGATMALAHYLTLKGLPPGKLDEEKFRKKRDAAAALIERVVEKFEG